MQNKSHPARSALTAALAFAAGLAAPAVAQDCALAVQASPFVLTPGQSAAVDVVAKFPAEAYAFAASEFDLAASHPSWTAASSGAIIGNDVFGASHSQAHAPQLGIFADPTNPFPVWAGEFTPTSSDPAFVQIKAVPNSFWIYPSKLTSSSVPCDADSGNAWCFVNPVRVGEYAAAPGEGTSMDDVWVDGRIITAEGNGESAILIGLLIPAVQKVRSAPARPGFDEQPNSLILRTHTGAGPTPGESFTLNYEKATWESRPAAHADFPLGVSLQIQFSLGGRPVGRIDDAQSGEPLFEVARFPESFSSRIDGLQVGTPWKRVPAPAPHGWPWQISLVMSCGYDTPVEIQLPSGRTILADRVELAGGMRGSADRPRPELLAESFAATGVRQMTIELPKP